MSEQRIEQELREFHRQCLRMAELVRSGTLGWPQHHYVSGSLATVAAEVESRLRSEARREATMITDGSASGCCPEPVWEGPYTYSCGKGVLDGVCPTHGRFRFPYADEGRFCEPRCQSRKGACNACGDPDQLLGSDGRCAGCCANTNPAHSWCLP